MTQKQTAHPSRHALAHHEAGHAVIALLLGRGVKSVVITPGSRVRLGLCEHYTRRWKPGALTEGQFRHITETDVCISLAGLAAEARLLGRAPRGWALQQDVVDAAESASLVCFSAAEASAYLNWLIIKTGQLVTSCWPAIQAVAAALLDGSKLTGRAVRELMRAAPAR